MLLTCHLHAVEAFVAYICLLLFIVVVYVLFTESVPCDVAATKGCKCNNNSTPYVCKGLVSTSAWPD